MKKKKVLAMALATVMACSSLVAYGSAEEKVEMAFSWWGSQEIDARYMQMIDMYMEENPHVSLEGTPFDWNAYWDKMATNAAGGSLPEILMMDYQYLEQYGSKGQLLDLQPYIDSGALQLDGVSEMALAAGKVDGTLYGIAFTGTPSAMQYNQTLLDEAGIAVKDNMTLDEFLDLAREIYEKTGYKTDLAYGNEHHLRNLLMGEGKLLYGDHALGVDQTDLQEYFELYEMGMEEGWLLDVAVYAERDINAVEQHPLVYGTAPENMAWNAFLWGNQLSQVQIVAPEGMEISMTTFPSENPTLSNYSKPGSLFTVPANCANPDEAVAFINWMMNDVEGNMILGTIYGLHNNSKVVEGISDILTDTEKKLAAYIDDVINPNCSPVWPADPGEAAEFCDLYLRVVDQLLYGELDAAAAAETLYTQGNEILAAE